jgi:peroxiredoxin (alkyl hydroperoxide reductase subunit C)
MLMAKPGLLAWTNASRRDGGLGKIDIPLLSDKNHQLSKDYGVLIEEEGIALRGLFIIDPNGVVRQITINDLPVGRSVDETLRLIDAFQFTDKYGEVCPANWNPGDKTIKATPEGNKEFTSKAYADKMDTNGTK